MCVPCRVAFLVQRCRGGDSTAREDLARRALEIAGRQTRRLTNHTIADEAAQDAALVAIEHIADLRDPGRFDEWVRRIATRCAWRHGRKTRKRAITESPVEDMDNILTGARQLGDGGYNPAEVLVAEVMAALPPRQRRALLLRHLLGYSEADVGRDLGCPAAAASALLHRARANFRLWMREPHRLRAA